MVKVKLMGEMGEKFGTDWVSADNNMRDILKLIEAQTDGFAEYLKDLVEQDNVGLEIVHGDQLLVETEDDIADMFLPVIKDTVYITPVPAGAGLGDVFKIIIGIALIIFAPQILGFLTSTSGYTWALAIETGAGLTAMLAIASVGGMLALKGLTDYLTPQTPGNSPDSYLFGNAQENVKMGSPVPVLYGELIVPGVTINYGLKDTKINGTVGGYSYGGSSGGAAGGGGGSGGGSGGGGGTRAIQQR
jgi:predicted phage tail protein